MKRIFRQLLFFVLLVTCAATVQAQQPAPTQEPLMGSEASPAVVLPNTELSNGFGGADGIYRILVVGDALAGGLGAGMTRMVQDDPRFEIVNRFNESSGISRPEVYDWPSAIEKIVADRSVDAVVVLVGVNDRQDIRRDNFRYPFKSPDWLDGYQANVDRLLASVKTANAVLVWVSIPPMEDPGFDADMRYLSEIHAKRVAAVAGHYVDVRPFFLAADGSYVDRGPDETGVERKLRSRDGVTFFKQGNNRFGQLVIAEINQIATGSAVGLPPAVPALNSNIASAVTTIPAASTPSVNVDKGSPTFGQDGLDGEQITFRADAVQPATPAAQSVAQRTSANTSDAPDVKLTAKPGSEAQRLFTEGIFAAAPTGRFDDFIVPALQ
jgi:uncharacterized protein